jgi:hypothetical protein
MPYGSLKSYNLVSKSRNLWCFSRNIDVQLAKGDRFEIDLFGKVQVACPALVCFTGGVHIPQAIQTGYIKINKERVDVILITVGHEVYQTSNQLNSTQVQMGDYEEPIEGVTHIRHWSLYVGVH